MPLTSSQRTGLWLVAALGFFGPNGIFLYYAAFRWSELMAEHRHPVAAAFIAEAILLMVFGAVVLARRPMGRHGWKTFVGLSMVGGLLFSAPMMILLNAPAQTSDGE